MFRFLIAAAFIATSISAASAQYLGGNGNSYSSSGNSYRGYNSNTGSTWSSTTSPGGNQSGIDSRGNSWSYNRGSGVYQNYGTGETRVRGQRY